MAGTILVVDDEPSIVEVVSIYLRREGFTVLTAFDGESALALAREHQPDLILLDIMLPKQSGLEITRTLRMERAVPIILLTARGDEADRIVGLELGADDYVVKPFSPREVVARVKAVLRRSIRDDVNTGERPLTLGTMTVVPSERVVMIDGTSVDLTAKEFDLLYFLASHPRQVFTRDQLLDRVWGTEYIADESTVTVHVRRLREKIERDPSNPEYVVTVWGVGYKFSG
ncbi:MAG TPA: response regulator transcription factor [Thermomicrobiales bacterium]|nr:response regulator transcription factor [Thermomicrobiales bacterium]